MYVFRNLRRWLELRLLHRSFSVSHDVQVTVESVHPLSLHYTKSYIFKVRRGFLSTNACATGYGLTYVTTLKLQWVSWVVVGLTVAKFKYLILPVSGFILSSTTYIQSQTYFTTGGLARISSSWLQVPWDSWPEFFFFFFWKLNPCDHNLYITLPLSRGWVLLWISLVFVQCTYRIYNKLLKILPFALFTSPPSIEVLEKRPCLLLILCCNGSLVSWTVVSLIAAKFKPFIFYISGVVLFYAANKFIPVILYDFCLLPTHFCYIIVYMRKVETRVQTRAGVHFGIFPMVRRTFFARVIGVCSPKIPKRGKHKSLLS
jgi:hypothetical protein